MDDSDLRFLASGAGGSTRACRIFTVSGSPFNLCVDGDYTVTGGSTSIIPTSPFTATVKIWGAGGGSGVTTCCGDANPTRISWGGGAGYAKGNVSFVAGTTYFLTVGGGGPNGSAPPGAQGGGGSAIYLAPDTTILAAGGGGGASAYYGQGGHGGGPSGQPGGGGDSTVGFGGGASQAAGGTGGTPGRGGAGCSHGGGNGGFSPNPGSPAGAAPGWSGGSGGFKPGDGGGGGGGGGYFGGGGGGFGSWGRGGGGGSGFANPTYVTNSTLTPGNDNLAGNNSDPDRGSTAGNGTAKGACRAGGNPGRLVIKRIYS